MNESFFVTKHKKGDAFDLVTHITFRNPRGSYPKTIVQLIPLRKWEGIASVPPDVPGRFTIRVLDANKPEVWTEIDVDLFLEIRPHIG